MLEKILNSKYRKELGTWGEQQLDQWMAHIGWNSIAKNKKIHGGEIDRVYFRKINTIERFCIAEVKTNVFYTQKEFLGVFSEVGIKKYLKQKQMRNIYRYGEQILVRKNTQVFLRLFIVLKAKDQIQKWVNLIKFKNALKICSVENNLLILSFEPEFTPFQSRKSLLQIKI